MTLFDRLPMLSRFLKGPIPALLCSSLLLSPVYALDADELLEKIYGDKINYTETSDILNTLKKEGFVNQMDYPKNINEVGYYLNNLSDLSFLLTMCNRVLEKGYTENFRHVMFQPCRFSVYTFRETITIDRLEYKKRYLSAFMELRDCNKVKKVKDEDTFYNATCQLTE